MQAMNGLHTFHQMSVSVIIPIFNQEKYLPDAIESVFRQTFSDWELILVDDGSTDNSPRICERYARESSKVKVIHKKNGGLSSARNAGLDIAGGEYIFFLDADDIIRSSALAILHSAAVSHKLDVVAGGIKKFTYTGKLSGSEPYLLSSCEKDKITVRTLSGKDALRRILYQKSGIDNSACGKLYRASLWKDLRFREGTQYEDLDIISPLMLKARKTGYIKDKTYFYRQHPESFLHTFSRGRMDVLEVTQRIVDYISEECPPLIKAAQARQVSANFNVLFFIRKVKREGDIDKESAFKLDEIARGCRDKLKELRMKTLFNLSMRLKNKLALLLFPL